jgi:hypothetical protein
VDWNDAAGAKSKLAAALLLRIGKTALYCKLREYAAILQPQPLHAYEELFNMEYF